MENWRENKIIHWTLVLAVFAITGSTIARLGTFITVEVGHEKYGWLWWVMLVVLLPVYSGLLLLVAFLFGKYEYFKAKQMKMWGRIGKLFKRKSNSGNED